MKIYSDLSKNSVLGLKSLANFLEKSDMKAIKLSNGVVVDFARNIEFCFSFNKDEVPNNFTKEKLENLILRCFEEIDRDYNFLTFCCRDLEKELNRCNKGLKKAIDKNMRSIDYWEKKLSEVKKKLDFVENNFSNFDKCINCCEHNKVGFKIWFHKTKKSVEGTNVYLLPFFILEDDKFLYFKIYKHRIDKYDNDMFTQVAPNSAYLVSFMRNL